MQSVHAKSYLHRQALYCAESVVYASECVLGEIIGEQVTQDGDQFHLALTLWVEESGLVYQAPATFFYWNNSTPELSLKASGALVSDLERVNFSLTGERVFWEKGKDHRSGTVVFLVNSSVHIRTGSILPLRLEVLLDGYHTREMVNALEIRLVNPVRGLWEEDIHGLKVTQGMPFQSGASSWEALIASHRFQTRRNFRQYAEIFPLDFIETLIALGPQAHWLDVGSGEGFAIQEFLSQHPIDEVEIKSIRKAMEHTKIDEQGLTWEHELDRLFLKLVDIPQARRPRCTGVTFRLHPVTHPAQQLPPVSQDGDFQAERIRIVQGKLFEDLNQEEIGSVDVMTDLLGAFAYSGRLDEVLRNYFLFLNKDGVIYIFLRAEWENPSCADRMKWELHSTRIRTVSGEELDIAEWLLRNETIDVQLKEHEILFDLSAKRAVTYRSLELRRKVSHKVSIEPSIPKLRLIEIGLQKPPQRVFEEVGVLR